jgi:hypothetical protein
LQEAAYAAAAYASNSTDNARIDGKAMSQPSPLAESSEHVPRKMDKENKK